MDVSIFASPVGKADEGWIYPMILASVYDVTKGAIEEMKISPGKLAVHLK